MKYQSLWKRKSNQLKNNFPNELEVIADCNDMVMGIKHKSKNVYGVQFHPESIKTDNGLKIIENFINL